MQTEVVSAAPISPAGTTLEFEEAQGADVTATSRQGAGGMRRRLLGSVGDTLVRASPGPHLQLRLSTV